MEKLLIKYLDTCISELDYKHQFYFDAADVIDILKGVNLFYESASGYEFQTFKFENDNRVVQALAYSGYIDSTINLLPPHQAELADKIKKGIYDTIPVDKLLERFWKNDLNFFRKFKNIVDTNDTLSQNILDEWVIEKGKDLFKAISYSYGFTWQERMIEIFDEERFQLEQYKIDDIEIYDQELFNALLDSFGRISSRSDKSESNYRDVIALMYLSKQVKLFNKQKIKNIPIFFDSQKYIDVIPSNILNNYFRIKISGQKFSTSSNSYALRSADYFKVYSLLKFNHTFPDEDNKYKKFVDNQNRIESLRKSLENIRFRENILGSQDKLERDKKDLEIQITNYINYDFFKTILLKTITEKNIINKVFEDIDIKQVSDDVFKKLKDKVDKILLKIGKDINDIIYWSAKIFTEIESRVSYLRKVNEDLLDSGISLDIYYHYSLFRFFIPDKYQSSINILFSNDGLLSKNLETYRTANVSLWNLEFRSANYGKSSNFRLNEEELFKLFCSFWILNLHDYISKINVDYGNLHHSLLMLKGACLNRAITELKRDGKDYKSLLNSLRKIISTLLKRVRHTNLNDYSYGEVRIAISYLYFQLWLQQGNEVLLESRKNINDIDFNHGSYNYKAVKYAKEAFDHFDKLTEKENKYRVYALNIYIYFTIDTAPLEEFKKINTLVDEFISLKGVINDWHFRYDDTIARNFHRLSLLASSKDSKLVHAITAVDILKSSLSKLKYIQGRDIKEVEAYLLRLQNYIGELERLKI